MLCAQFFANVLLGYWEDRTLESLKKFNPIRSYPDRSATESGHYSKSFLSRYPLHQALLANANEVTSSNLTNTCIMIICATSYQSPGILLISSFYIVVFSEGIRIGLLAYPEKYVPRPSHSGSLFCLLSCPGETFLWKLNDVRGIFDITTTSVIYLIENVNRRGNNYSKHVQCDSFPNLFKNIQYLDFF